MSTHGLDKNKGMDEQDRFDQAFTQGRKSLAINIMRTCCNEIGLEQKQQANLAIERQEAVHMLRQVCEEHGDNDWPDDLYLADVIEKHLYRHLNSK